jgi:DNA processing protein
LITAGLALDQGRDVFAVPGSVDSVYSEGCNELIARGAKLVRSAKDVLEEYVGLYDFSVAEEEPPLEEPAAGQPQKAPRQTEAKLSAPQQPEPAPTLEAVFAPAKTATQDPVLAAIDGVIHLEEIARRTGLDTAELLGRLTLLELRGKIRQLPGQCYEIV